LLKIGIDAQALQTESSGNRGVGRYSQNLIKKIFEKNLDDHFILFLNGLYKEKIDLSLNKHHELKSIQYLEPENFSDQTLNNMTQFLEYYKFVMVLLKEKIINEFF